MAQDFRNIIAWKKSDDLVIYVYKLTQDFPQNEMYGLTSQIRRSAISVAANIAEGATRRGTAEFLQFLYISKASLAETEYYLQLANRLDYISDSEYKIADEQRKEAAKLIQGLIRKLQNKEIVT